MPNKLICSGALLYSLSTQRFLLLHRTRGKHSNVWGLVGGTNEHAETPWQAVLREIQEEIGGVNILKSIPLETFVSNDERFSFHTYLGIVDQEFIPVLNDEHDGYCWVSFENWPRPLHQGLKTTLSKRSNITKLKTVFKTIHFLDLTK